ncbi:MAG: serine/threonine-protein kinase [Polyangiales bacterium]
MDVTLSEGAVLGGDYRIVRPLATGGMGAVYVVEQLSTGKHRALKVMLPGLVRDAERRGRFLAEAKISTRIESDNVVEVLGAGVDEATGTPWIVMELLEGDILPRVLERYPTVPPSGVLEIIGQLCDALGRAHRVGIIHSDIKPDNVYIAVSRRRGVPFTVKVLDFGIARLVSDETRAARVTTPMGSPLWMAPEQTTRGAEITTATDVWPLGLLVFRMLVGKPYWRTANLPDDQVNLAALVMEILVHELPSASQRARDLGCAQPLPPGFDAWFGRCVVRDPAQRYSDAHRAFAELEVALRPAPPPPDPRPSIPPYVPPYTATQHAPLTPTGVAAYAPAYATTGPAPGFATSTTAQGDGLAPGGRVMAAPFGNSLMPGTVVEVNQLAGLVRVRFDSGAEAWMGMSNVRR